MSTETVERPAKAPDGTRQWNEWVGEPKDEEKKKPQRGLWHLACQSCYGDGNLYHGAATFFCGKRGTCHSGQCDCGPRGGGRIDRCETCWRMFRAATPCPNADCPRRSWLGRIWRRIA